MQSGRGAPQKQGSFMNRHAAVGNASKVKKKGKESHICAQPRSVMILT